MAIVYIPASLRGLAAGADSIEVEGSNVRQLIDNIEKMHPGLRERLIENGRLRTNVSVAVDGEVSPLGLLEPVSPESEVHFVAAISGGTSLKNSIFLDIRSLIP